jgi:hypothetical protein
VDAVLLRLGRRDAPGPGLNRELIAMTIFFAVAVVG